uniref:Uncharacterized protein n=1 Tax=Laticauda laticaudata TaxID=8630 RepID=A0A8C5S0N8_LATLA
LFFCFSVKFLVINFVFFLLILSPATAPNCSISLINFCPLSIGSSMKNTKSSANACNLYSSDLIFSPFISGFCLILIQGRERQPCLTPFSIFIGQVISPFTIILASCVEIGL